MHRTCQVGIALAVFALSSGLARAQSFGFARGFGSTAADGGDRVFVDAAGNVYVWGFFENTVDLDPGPGIANVTSAGGADAFFTKYTASGALIWARSIGGLTVDAAGNVYVAGSFERTVDFDPGPGTFNLTGTGLSSDIGA